MYFERFNLFYKNYKYVGNKKLIIKLDITIKRGLKGNKSFSSPRAIRKINATGT